jgi:hypothetical protein
MRFHEFRQTVHVRVSSFDPRYFLPDGILSSCFTSSLSFQTVGTVHFVTMPGGTVVKTGPPALHAIRHLANLPDDKCPDKYQRSYDSQGDKGIIALIPPVTHNYLTYSLPCSWSRNCVRACPQWGDACASSEPLGPRSRRSNCSVSGLQIPPYSECTSPSCLP